MGSRLVEVTLKDVVEIDGSERTEEAMVVARGHGGNGGHRNGSDARHKKSF